MSSCVLHNILHNEATFFSRIVLEFYLRLQEILFSNHKYLIGSNSKIYRISRKILAQLSFKCSFLNDLGSAMIYQHFETCKVQSWTEGRSSTAIAKDLRPTATVAEVCGHSYGRRLNFIIFVFFFQNGGFTLIFITQLPRLINMDYDT